MSSVIVTSSCSWERHAIKPATCSQWIINTQKHTHTHEDTYTNGCRCTHTCMHAHTHTRIDVRTCTRTPTHTHIYPNTHTNTQSGALGSLCVEMMCASTATEKDKFTLPITAVNNFTVGKNVANNLALQNSSRHAVLSFFAIFSYPHSSVALSILPFYLALKNVIIAHVRFLSPRRSPSEPRPPDGGDVNVAHYRVNLSLSKMRDELETRCLKLAEDHQTCHRRQTLCTRKRPWHLLWAASRFLYPAL